MKISIVAGQIALIKSSITAEVVKTLEAVKPAALRLKDENKNDVFVVAMAAPKAKPVLSNLGMTVSKDNDIVIQYDKPVTEAKVKEDLGPALLKLQQLERQVETALAAVNADLNAIAVEVVEVA